MAVVAAGQGWLDRELEGLQDFPRSWGGDSRMQVSIFQGHAIFQQRQSQSFGKALEKTHIPQKWVRPSPGALEMPKGRSRASSRVRKQSPAAVKKKEKKK